MDTVDTPRSLRHRAGRLAGALVLVLSSGAALAAFPRPAAAEESSPTVKWSGRSDDLRGSVRVRADVSAGEPVDGWVLRGLTASGEPAFDPICDDTFRKPRRSFDLECRWDTTRYPDGRWSANRHYLLRLEVRRGDGVGTIGPDRDTTVDNPAAAPTGVAVTYDPDGRRAVVTWTANLEPDIDHYDIEEQVDKKSWRPAGESRTTSFERQLSEPGQYRFRVAAERRGPDGEAGRRSDWTRGPASARKPDQPGSERPETASGKQSPAAPGKDGARPARAADGGDDAGVGTTGTEPSSPAGASDATGGTSSSASTRPAAGPPGGGAAPAERRAPPPTAAPVFPASTEAAFEALSLTRRVASPRTAVSGPTKAGAFPPGRPEPDEGFEEILPYPTPEPEPAAAEPDPRPAIEAADGAAPARGRPVAHRLGRLLGMLLIAGGTGALVLAVGSTRRPIRPNPGTTPTVAPADATGLGDIRARLDRLEARVLAEPGGASAMPLWQLPTG